jgi:outer membrane protein OmpA-like peptidoglycan-associated protein
MSGKRTRMISCVLALPLALLAACGGGAKSPAPSPTPALATGTAAVKGSVISTATSSNEMQVAVPGPVATSWTAVGQNGGDVEWIKVTGDGTNSDTNVDFTKQPDQASAALAGAINADAAQTDGRQALAGLDGVKSPAGTPVWVFSPMLDTAGPLNFNQLAFDTSPVTVVKATKQAGKLPDLKGRDVTFVVSPPAGEQKKLSKLQVGYQHAVWEGIARAGGAKRVTFYDGTGTSPGTGSISPIAVPNPNDKFASSTSGKTRTCTLPAPALFVSDQPTLIDKAATRKELKDCIGQINSTTKISVEGHTAGVAGADNTFAKNLSTQRATEVAALLKELGVPAKNVVKVVGYGSAKPLVQPASDPKNRAVVVTFTSSG